MSDLDKVKAVCDAVAKGARTEWEGFAAVPHEFIEGGDTIVALGKCGGKAVRFVQYVDTLLVRRAVDATL